MINKNILCLSFLLFYNSLGFAQLPQDTFDIKTISNGIKQLSYTGKLPETDKLLQSVDFSDKLISCIAGKYLLDTLFQNLDSGTTVKSSNSYLEIKRVSKTELVMSTFLDMELIDYRPLGKSKFNLQKQGNCFISINNGRLEIEKNWRIDFQQVDLGFLKVEYWLRGDCNKVEIERYYSKKGRRFKKNSEELPDRAKIYIPILTNSSDENWQIYFLFHDNARVPDLIFRKVN